MRVRAKCRVCRCRTADWGLEDRSEGWVCRSHLPPRRTELVERHRGQRSCWSWSTRTARPSAPRRSSPPIRRPVGCTGRSPSSSSTSAGRLLLQQRALGKYHSPGVWSNTCCGHPYPGEAPFAAAARRTFEELGVSPSLLARGGHGPLQPPGPGLGPGGAGVQPPVRRAGAGRAAAGPGGGRGHRVRDPGRAGGAACQGRPSPPGS